MKFGLFGIGSGGCADPENAVAVAQLAEERGFDSLWTGEHVVLPDPRVPPSPAGPTFPMLHPSTALAFVAGVTSRIKLGTGIVLVPQRNPVVLAKELASLDVVSRGRLLFGMGVGYLEPEFRALGIPFEGRGRRADEYLEAMQALWTQEKPAYNGKYVSFSGVQARPLPVQKPHPPVIVGGTSAPAIRRAVERANGWYGFALDFESTKRALGDLAEATKRCERPPELGELEISLTPGLALNAEAVWRFEDMGVHRLIPTLAQRTRAELCDFVRQLADELIRF